MATQQQINLSSELNRKFGTSISSDVQDNLDNINSNINSIENNYLPLAGGTMIGNLYLYNDTLNALYSPSISADQLLIGGNFLGSAAFQDISAFDAAGSALFVQENSLPLSGGIMNQDAIIAFQNGSNLTQGTTDLGIGGNKGISLKCSVNYELNYQAGRLTNFQQDGVTVYYLPLGSPLLFLPNTAIQDSNNQISIDPNARVLHNANGDVMFDWSGNTLTGIGIDSTINTQVYNNSANWNEAYSSWNSASANVATTEFTDSKYLPLSGGTLVGNIGVNNNPLYFNIDSSNIGNSYGDFNIGSSNNVVINPNTNLILTENIGNVGIGTLNPATKLDVNGVITVIGGNSDKWNNVYSSVNTQSANNTSVYSTVQANSAVNWSYQGTDIKSLTSNWQNSFTKFSSQSANNLSVYSNVNSNSANNANVYNTVNANSAVTWNYQGTDIKSISANWQNTFNGFSTQSANNLSVYSNVNSNSANYNSNYTTFNSQSANNLSVFSSVNTNSANWNSVYSNVNNNSASYINVVNTVQSNSAVNWNYQGTDIKTLTGNWQNTFNTVKSGSATWNTYNTLSSLLDVNVSAPANNQLLSFNSVINKWTASSGTSPLSSTGYYGSFYDSTTSQTCGSTTSAYQILIGSSYESNGVSLSANSAIIQYTGVYQVYVDIQIINTANASQDINLWFRKNGNDIPNSVSTATVPSIYGGSGGSAGKTLGSNSILLSLTSGDSISVWWSVKNTNVTIQSVLAQTNPVIPATPGVMFYITKVSAAVGLSETAYTTVNSNSANWNSVFSNVQNNSAIQWNYQGTDIKSISSNWQNTFTTVQTNSSVWLLSGLSVETDPVFTSWAQSNSANFYNTFTTVQNNSSLNWNYQGTDIKSLTSNWQNTYTGYNSQSGNYLTTTLTNRSLTGGTFVTPILNNPSILSGGYIADANNKPLLTFVTTPSAVNQIIYANASTGNNPTFTLSGADANIGETHLMKGTGSFTIKAGTNSGNPQQWLTSTGSVGAYVRNDGFLVSNAGIGTNVIYNASLGVVLGGQLGLGGANGFYFNALCITGPTQFNGSQGLSGAGAINLSTTVTKFTSTGAAQALTLADGSDGQIKIIIHAVAGGTGVLTPTTKTGFTTITFNSAGDTATLMFNTTIGWVIISTRGATVV